MGTFREEFGQHLFACEVNGIPRPQGSMTAIQRRSGGVYMKSPDTLKMWRGKMIREFDRRLRDLQRKGTPGAFPSGPVAVYLEFLFPRPKNHSAKRAAADDANKYTTPDVDKLARAVLDAFTQSGVLGDDAQVTALTACKSYCEDKQLPGVFTTVCLAEGGWVTAADRKKWNTK